MVYRKAGGSDSRTLSMDAWVRKLGKGLLEYCGGGWISHSPFPFLSADTGREDAARVLVRVFLRALSRIESEFDIAEKVGKTVYRPRGGGGDLEISIHEPCTIDRFISRFLLAPEEIRNATKSANKELERGRPRDEDSSR